MPRPALVIKKNMAHLGLTPFSNVMDGRLALKQQWLIILSAMSVV